MAPQEFKKIWTSIDEPLSPLNSERLSKFNLSKATFDFLNIAGLPCYCSPDLSFVNDTDDIFNGINKLIDQYDFWDDKSKFEKYVIIGSCRDGDAIAIDTEDNQKIVELDHEDLFSSMYFNRSIEALAAFLVLYRDFETEVLYDKDSEDSFQCFNFTDEQFDRLKGNMYSIDPDAITKRGFWKEELEIIISIRQERLDKKLF